MDIGETNSDYCIVIHLQFFIEPSLLRLADTGTYDNTGVTPAQFTRIYPRVEYRFETLLQKYPAHRIQRVGLLVVDTEEESVELRQIAQLPAVPWYFRVICSNI